MQLDRQIKLQCAPQEAYVHFARDPRLRQVEMRIARYNRPTFQKHLHETYAIAAVEQGSCRFLYRQSTKIVGPESVVLINPGEVHACNPQAPSDWGYRMLYVDVALIRAIAAGLNAKTGDLPYFAPEVVTNAIVYQMLWRLSAALLESDNLLEQDSRLYAALSELVLHYSDHRVAAHGPQKPYKPIQRAYTYLMDNLTQNVTLAQLADVAGLSAYHLLRVFHAHFGLPPHAFQLQQRINVAKRMLADRVAVIQVASELGFTDQSHFTKKFKVFVGATPRQYQDARR
jgi:AraC-like DNA-binding protein